MRGPAYVSEPQVQYLSQLVDEVAAGHIQVPRFQRGFVWTDEQRLELLRSVRDGLPIGSILLWRTARPELPRSVRLGPHALPPTKVSGGVSQYLLDGHQRVTTLFGALYAGTRRWRAAGTPTNEENDDGLDWGIYYDLMAHDFLLARGESLSSHWLPLYLLLDSVALLSFQRSALRKDAVKIREADFIARRFRETKIPVIPFVTDDLDLATRAFQRINSQGTPMGQLDMVAALVYRADFDLRERLDRMKQTFIELGWRLEEATLYDACKLALGVPVRSAQIDGTSSRLRVHPEALEQAQVGLCRAVKFLGERCGIFSQRSLPSVAQLLVLADWLREHPEPLDEPTAQGLLRWFWLACYQAIPMSEEEGSNLLRNFMPWLPHGASLISPYAPVMLSALPQRFDFRTARCRLLALRLAELRPSALDVLDAQRLLALHGGDAVVPFFPSGEAGTLDPHVRRWLRSPVNRILVAPEQAAATRMRLLDQFAGEELRSHAISKPTEANGESAFWEQVFAARAQQLEQLEVQFLSQLCGKVVHFRHRPS